MRDCTETLKRIEDRLALLELKIFMLMTPEQRQELAQRMEEDGFTSTFTSAR